jgi:glycine cleavage system aminomethyltransferase T
LSVHASSEHLSATLGSVVEQAGAVRTLRDGRSVVAHYGSAAGELAACVTAVGLADCSQLTKLVLRGPSRQLGPLTLRLAGAEVAPGGAVLSGGAWWCAESAEQIIVLCDPRLGDRLAAALHALAARRTALVVTNHSRDWTALAVAGRRARPLLAALGVFGDCGDPRQVPPFTSHPVAGVDVQWLLESDRKAVALMPLQSAASVWRTIEHAGEPYGLCAVGQQALARYALVREAGASL